MISHHFIRFELLDRLGLEPHELTQPNLLSVRTSISFWTTEVDACIYSRPNEELILRWLFLIFFLIEDDVKSFSFWFRFKLFLFFKYVSNLTISNVFVQVFYLLNQIKFILVV